MDPSKSRERQPTPKGEGSWGRPLKIEVSHRGDVCLFVIHGEIKFGDPILELSKTMKERLEEGDRLFLFDMLDVPWLDSSGMGEVVACHKRARERKGVVKLVLQGRSLSQFTLTHLEKMFDIFQDPGLGVASFDGPDGGYRERF